jgi:2'-5' RNA ligase
MPPPDSPSTPLRAFVALPLPDPQREALKRAQDELRQTRSGVKWVAPENFHVTLFFLGGVPADQVPAIEEALDDISRRHVPFPVTLHGVGAFPNVRNPQTVWAGIAGDLDALRALAADVSDAMVELDFERDKPFKPHLTLARARRDTKSRELSQLSEALQRMKEESFGDFVADEIIMFQSELRPHGPIYTPLSRFPLAGAG